MADEAVLFYNFTTASGTVVEDISNYNNNGTASATTLVDSLQYKGLRFASGSVVELPTTSTLDFTGSTYVSVVSLVNIDDAFSNKDEDIVNLGNNEVVLRKNDSNEWSFLFKDDSGTAYEVSDTASGSTSKWTHLVGTYNGISLNLYKNGNLIAASSTAVSIGDIPGTNAIGSDSGDSNYFNGIIDETRIYNFPFTQSEVKDLYYKDYLVLNYQFAEGTGTTAYDLSKSRNNGTIAATCSFTSGRFGYGLQFYGTQQVRTTHDPSLAITSGISIFSWINPTSQIVTSASLLSKDAYSNGYRFGLSSTNQIEFFGYKNNSQVVSITGPQISEDTWTHVGMTHSPANGNLTLYVNASAVAQKTDHSILGSGTADLFISGPNSVNRYKGKIDDVRLYRTSVSLSFISDIYNRNVDILKPSDTATSTKTDRRDSILKRMLDLLPAWWDKEGE